MINVQQIQEEIWVKVKGYEEYYEVSSFGRVRTIEKVIEIKSRAGWSRLHPVRSKIKVANKTKAGYFTIALVVNNKTITTYLHRIIAEAFIANPYSDKVVNHKNGIKSDNRLVNLEWCTSSHNNQHAIDLRLRSPRSGHLNERSILQIREMVKQGVSNLVIAKLLGVPVSVINRFINGHSYKYLKI